MGLGKRTGLELGSGVVRYTRSTSGKRVVILGSKEADFPAETIEQLDENLNIGSIKLQLEALPKDILVRILCCVDHDDLKRLFHVSKLIREATIVAKEWHFQFSTPTKKTFSLSNLMDVEPSEDAEEIEAPNAPKQLRIHKARLSEKKLANISVALFASADEEAWPRRKLFSDMEIDEYVSVLKISCPRQTRVHLIVSPCPLAEMVILLLLLFG